METAENLPAGEEFEFAKSNASEFSTRRCEFAGFTTRRRSGSFLGLSTYQPFLLPLWPRVARRSIAFTLLKRRRGVSGEDEKRKKRHFYLEPRLAKRGTVSPKPAPARSLARSTDSGSPSPMTSLSLSLSRRLRKGRARKRRSETDCN